MVPTMNSKEILWPDKQLTDQIQKAKEILCNGWTTPIMTPVNKGGQPSRVCLYIWMSMGQPNWPY